MSLNNLAIDKEKNNQKIMQLETTFKNIIDKPRALLGEYFAESV